MNIWSGVHGVQEKLLNWGRRYGHQARYALDAVSMWGYASAHEHSTPRMGNAYGLPYEHERLVSSEWKIRREAYFAPIQDNGNISLGPSQPVLHCFFLILHLLQGACRPNRAVYVYKRPVDEAGRRVTDG